MASKRCVNCEHDYDEEENTRWACSYHPGVYGRCDPIKKGVGWTCCGRGLLDKPCHTEAHNEYDKRCAPCCGSP